MDLHMVAVCDLRMCMKEDNPSQKKIKGDNYHSNVGQGYPFVI